MGAHEQSAALPSTASAAENILIPLPLYLARILPGSMALRIRNRLDATQL